jgi:hypothetical protein
VDRWEDCIILTRYQPDDQLKTYQQAVEFYNALHVRAGVLVDNAGNGHACFEGSAANYGMERLGLSRGRVSYLLTILAKVGSIELVRRGTQKEPSRYRIGSPPNATAVREAMREAYQSGKFSRPDKISALNDNLRALVQRVVELEDRVERLEHAPSTGEGTETG